MTTHITIRHSEKKLYQPSLAEIQMQLRLLELPWLLRPLADWIFINLQLVFVPVAKKRLCLCLLCLCIDQWHIIT